MRLPIFTSIHGMDLFWLFFLLGTLSFFLNQYRRLRKKSGWPITPGAITEFLWTKREGRLWADIEYQYDVDGQTYFSHSLVPESIYYSPHAYSIRKLVYQLALAYEKQEPIAVIYNANNPVEAYLNVRIPAKLKGIILLNCLLLLVHGSMILLRGS